MPSDSNSDEPRTSSSRSRGHGLSGWQRAVLRVVLWSGGIVAAGIASIVIIVGVALAVAYPNLPDISDLLDYRPKLPLRVYSSEGVLIGEFGEERRNLTP